MSLLIRPEFRADLDAIREVNRLAFGQDDEARLVDALRDGGYVRVSLVAQHEGRIVGHIVRNRLKIESSIDKANAFLAVQQEFGSFDKYIWTFVGGEPRQNAWTSLKEVPPRTAQSDAMSKDLKRRCFRFVGSTICYAFMQAVGMVNDHLVECFRHTDLRSKRTRRGSS